MKKFTLIFILLLSLALPGHAVLKESNLDTTLYILRAELTNYHLDLERQNQGMKNKRQEVIKNLMNIMNQAAQNSIMLYSQRNGYVFDLTYACNEAIEQFKKFKTKAAPFKNAIDKNNTEVARFDSLINYLYGMNTNFMSENAKMNRNISLTLAVNIRRQLVEKQQQQQAYVAAYHRTYNKLKSLHDYANKRYQEIQTNIFSNGDDNYLQILRNLRIKYRDAKESIDKKYRPAPGMVSQWDVRIIGILFGIIFFYGVISIALNLLVIRFFITFLIKRGRFESIRENFMAKRTCIILAMTIVTFAVMLGIIRVLSHQNFIVMACGLLVEYAWLVGVVLLSLLLRVSNSQIKSAFRIYSPLMLVAFVVITFRIILIPNDLVNLIFPPILLICSLWQWSTVYRYRHKVSRNDKTFAYISLSVFIISTCCSWIGFTLLAVQIIIWWMMQLTCILTIACLKGWLKVYAKKNKVAEQPITRKWIYCLIDEVVIPVAAALSFMISIYWAADVFNMSDTTWMIFNREYIKTSNFTASIMSIVQALTLFFVFKYINDTTNQLMHHHFYKQDPDTAASKIVMFKNVLQVFIWGLWLIIALTMFNVGKSWLLAIFAGLSTGLGFASKDILENIYYGISLMMGRAKVGDYIICDGTRGRVSSISYTSTMLEAIDGSIIAFQNSQLFAKNYKNMTRNHGYELDILEVGVAYGTNIKEAKQLLVDAIMKLDCVYKEKGVKVVLKSFDDSCITLKILVWVNVLTQYVDDGKIMECIYETLNRHNIEIPFPQREVTIKNAAENKD